MAVARHDLTRLLVPGTLALFCVPVGVFAGLDPTLAIIASLGVGFALLALANLAAGVMALIVVSFLEQVPLVGGSLTLTKLIGALIGLSWLARLSTGKARLLPSSHPYTTFLIIGLVGWAALSVSWADDRGAALSDLSRYALVGLLYAIVFTAVRERRHVSWIVWGYVGGAAVTCAYGLAVRPETEDVGRLSSTITDANVLAAVLVAGLALSLGLALAAHKSAGERVFASGAAVLFLFTFLLTGSRGGLVALAAMILAAVLVAGRWRAGVVAVALVVAASTVLFYAEYAPPEIRDRVIAATQGEQEVGGGRDTIWQVGWRMVEDNPVRGVGVGSFKTSSIDYVLEPGRTRRTDEVIDDPNVAHNAYLGVVAELGAIGLALFIGVLLASVAALISAVRLFERLDDHRMEVLGRSLIVALVGLFAAIFFISEQVNKQLWLLLALGPAMLALARAQMRETGPRS